MRYLNDIGFVVKRVNLGEADRFVTLFTKNNGKIEVLAKGVRKINSRRSSHIELLNLINFNSVKTSKNYILTEVDLVSAFESRKQTLDQCDTLFLLCELINALCPHEQVNREIYSLLGRFIQKGDFSSEAILLWQTNILIELGYWDGGREFKTEKESRQFIEQILERKIRSRLVAV